MTTAPQLAQSNWLVTSDSKPGNSTVSSTASLTLGQKTGGDIDFVRAGGSLVFCLLLAVALIFLIKKVRGIPGKWTGVNGGGKSSRLKVVESTRLNPSTTLYVVEFNTGTVSQSILLVQDASGIKQLNVQLTASNAV